MISDVLALYERLHQIGLNRDLVELEALPDWWIDECYDLPDAAITIAFYVYRRFKIHFN